MRRCLSGLWVAGTPVALLTLAVEMTTSLRRCEFELDVIAVMAMAGALLLHEHFASVVIALMFTGGQTLEAFAQRRATRELTALLGRTRRTLSRREA